MADAVARYLARRAEDRSRALEGDRAAGVDRIIVIPALAERERLPATLECLAGNPAERLSRTQVIVVVNNSPQSGASRDVYDENQETLGWLRGDGARALDGLRLSWIDASSAGHELEPGGVGAARKLGLDYGLRLLVEGGNAGGALINLDADTLVEADYLPALEAHFARDDAWGSVVDFAHVLEGSRDQRQAILEYEAFLRYHVLGLRYARSPYAFHTLGSIMACTGEAYAAVAGMNRRHGGEDFYFLQSLAKTGGVATVWGTRVHPSSRASWRVPFGTGPRVADRMREDAGGFLGYAPECYGVVREWNRAVVEGLESDAGSLLDRAARIEAELAAYLSENNFVAVWTKLQANARERSQLLAQYHRWFDSLKTLRLIHRLRDACMPARPLRTCLASAVGWFDGDNALLGGSDEETFCPRTVDALRDLERATV